jgi:hypothetical protein
MDAFPARYRPGQAATGRASGRPRLFNTRRRAGLTACPVIAILPNELLSDSGTGVVPHIIGDAATDESNFLLGPARGARKKVLKLAWRVWAGVFFCRGGLRRRVSFVEAMAHPGKDAESVYANQAIHRNVKLPVREDDAAFRTAMQSPGL